MTFDHQHNQRAETCHKKAACFKFDSQKSYQIFKKEEFDARSFKSSWWNLADKNTAT